MPTSKVGQENETAEPEASNSMPVMKTKSQAQTTMSDYILEEVKEEEQETKPEPKEDARQQHAGEEEKQQPIEEDATQKVALQVSDKEKISETKEVEGDAVEKAEENITMEKDESNIGSKSLKRRTRYGLNVVFTLRKSKTKLESYLKCCS